MKPGPRTLGLACEDIHARDEAHEWECKSPKVVDADTGNPEIHPKAVVRARRPPPEVEQCAVDAGNAIDEEADKCDEIRPIKPCTDSIAHMDPSALAKSPEEPRK